MKITKLLYFGSVMTLVSAALVFNPQSAAAACPPLASDKGSATLVVDIAEAGTYRVWSRIMAPDTTNNSYWLQIDDAYCNLNVGDAAIPANNYTWVDYKAGATSNKITVTLSAGSHTLRLAGREANVRVDQLLFLSDLNCVPTGFGVCATTPVPQVPVTPSPTPVVVSGGTTPSSGVVSLQPKTAAVKTEFRVNGRTITGNQLDTTKLTNGEHVVEVISTDEKGVVTIEKQKLVVDNIPAVVAVTNYNPSLASKVKVAAPYLLGLITVVALGAAALIKFFPSKFSAGVNKIKGRFNSIRPASGITANLADKPVIYSPDKPKQ